MPVCEGVYSFRNRAWIRNPGSIFLRSAAFECIFMEQGREIDLPGPKGTRGRDRRAAPEGDTQASDGNRRRVGTVAYLRGRSDPASQSRDIWHPEREEGRARKGADVLSWLTRG